MPSNAVDKGMDSGIYDQLRPMAAIYRMDGKRAITLWQGLVLTFTRLTRP